MDSAAGSQRYHYHILQNLGIAIPDIYGFGGIVLVMTLQLFPLVFLYAKGALKNIDNSPHRGG